MKYETIHDCPRKTSPYAFLLKYSYKYASSNNSNKKIEDLTKDEFFTMFPFASLRDKQDNVLKRTKVKEFPLAFFKKKLMDSGILLRILILHRNHPEYPLIMIPFRTTSSLSFPVLLDCSIDLFFNLPIFPMMMTSFT